MYIAIMDDGVFEANSLLELKRNMARWYYDNGLSVVDIEAVREMHDDAEVDMPAITVIGIEGEIERMIITYREAI